MKAKVNNYNEAVQRAAMVPDGLRHLRNFAKKRHANDLLKVVYQHVNGMTPKEAEK